MKLKQREMHIRLDTGVWYNPINKVMNSPELVDETHASYVSFCEETKSSRDRQSLKRWSKSTRTWMHMQMNACRHEHKHRLFNSLQNFLTGTQSNTERWASCMRNRFHTNELTLFYFTQALPFNRLSGFQFLCSSALRFTLHAPARPTRTSLFPAVYVAWF